MAIDMNDIEDQLLKVVAELPLDRRMEVLDFAMFLQMQGVQQPGPTMQPVRQLEDLFGDFWPDEETVDKFVDAVRRWRREDLDLHRNLK